MCHIFVHFAIFNMKCSYLQINGWKFLYLFWTCWWWFSCKVYDFWILGWLDVIFWSKVWQFVSHQARSTSWFYLKSLEMLNWAEILCGWSFVCWDHMWFFLELLNEFSNWLIIFFSVCSFGNIVWYMLAFCLWNSHSVLDEDEIWYVDCRHIIGHHSFDPIHFLIVVTVLWIIEMDACLDVLNWLT
jgi:hypothetical protein